MVERAVRALASVLCVVSALATGGCGGDVKGTTDGAPLVNVTLGGDDAGSTSSPEGAPTRGPTPTLGASPGSPAATASDAMPSLPPAPGRGPPTLGAPLDAARQPARDAAADVSFVEAGPARFADAANDVSRDDGRDALVERVVPEAGGADRFPDAAAERARETAGDQMCGRIRCDCTLDGIRLWGNVQYVLSGGTFKVLPSAQPDLLIQISYAPSSCGEWAEVTQGGDFTVEFVTEGEDFQIQYALAPGVAKPPGAP